MKQIIENNSDLQKLIFLIKLEGELRKPENEIFSIINGEVRRVK